MKKLDAFTEGLTHTHYRFIRVGTEHVVAECIARDEHTALRMLDAAVCEWDLTQIHVVAVSCGHRGPNYFIRIDPTNAPMISDD